MELFIISLYFLIFFYPLSTENHLTTLFHSPSLVLFNIISITKDRDKKLLEIQNDQGKKLMVAVNEAKDQNKYL